MHLSIILVINQLDAQILLISTQTNAHICTLVDVLIKWFYEMHGAMMKAQILFFYNKFIIKQQFVH